MTNDLLRYIASRLPSMTLIEWLVLGVIGILATMLLLGAVNSCSRMSRTVRVDSPSWKGEGKFLYETSVPNSLVIETSEGGRRTITGTYSYEFIDGR